ncbi:hypothetical protein LDENG_00021590 [Lucifuga dentata]|nr:hypothetical protein LDENG_00021590 [Lucifuga dentata]
MLFVYMLPLGDIICKYGVKFHCYADYTLLYVPVKPNDLSQLLNLGACLLEMKKWMGMNFLLLNANKTGLLVVRLAKYGHFFENFSVNIDACIISESLTIKNLGMIFDSHLTFQSHIKSITKTAFIHLSNIAKIRPIIAVMLKVYSMHLYPPDLITVTSFSLVFQIMLLEVCSLSRML